ncbi:succinate dehydrogenase assembly factor 2, mitochondrial [Andrographis paniculata]|uniref:succinate dehydrogenase assembly factor 2, mitochondrial n=1 Tax=Andrographis paniculata TaxID=175694 RepID=UPI0021E939D5|nr:succinate dehydrogenase assembly factor 2, mitochondrial [Andrographis paniculata]
MASSSRALVCTVPRILGYIRTSVSVNQNFQRPVLASFQRFYSSTESKSLDIDLSNEESKRRLYNRMLYRSKQRGFLELDLVLGKWVEDHITSMDENGIRSLHHILDLENPDLWRWLTSQEQPPEAVARNHVFVSMRERVSTNLEKHTTPETRATPGQPWVRGWDDFKKGRDSPITGNQ